MANNANDVDLDVIKLHVVEGMAICALMAGFSDDEDLDSAAVRALGIQMHEKFEKIRKSLNL